MEKNDLLGVHSALRHLKKFIAKENEISSQIALNKIMSLSQEQTALYNSDWILVIMSLFEGTTAASDICLKILLNASKKYEEARWKLLNNKIFYVLTIRLREETDFWKSSLILYSALIIVLVQGNTEAQNQMRTSGCLSSIVNILSCILDEVDTKPLPQKNTELLIYTMIASNKNPPNPQNQTEIGWIIPKVLEYLCRISFSDGQQFQLIKTFWLLLKTALDRNEMNQHIFIKSSGVGVLFRSIQEVLQEQSCIEIEDLLSKMTGIMLIMRRNKEFLYQVSHYCPLMILCNILKKYNCLVVQQVIILLNELTQEFPQTLKIIKTKDVKNQIKKAKMIIMKSKTTAEVCQNLWKRLKIFDETPMLREGSEQSSFSPGLGFPSDQFCVIHDVGNSPINSDAFGAKNQILNKIRGRNRLRRVDKKSKSILRRIGNNLRKKITFIFKKLLRHFVDGFNKKFVN